MCAWYKLILCYFMKLASLSQSQVNLHELLGWYSGVSVMQVCICLLLLIWAELTCLFCKWSNFYKNFYSVLRVFVLNFGVWGNVQNCFLGALVLSCPSPTLRVIQSDYLISIGVGRGSVSVIGLYFLMKLRTFHTEHSGVKNAPVSFVWAKRTK